MADAPKDTLTPEQDETSGKSVLVITDDKVEDLEFFYPYYRFIEEGYAVDVATPDGGEFKGKNGYTFRNTWKVTDVSPLDYDLLFLPGGKAPEKLKKNDEVVALVKNFARSGRPIAAICHGPQILAAADLIRDRSIAAWPEVQEEIEDAGATYVDESSVVDAQFITARWPGDLPAFMKRVLEVLEAGRMGRPGSIHTSHLTV